MGGLTFLRICFILYIRNFNNSKKIIFIKLNKKGNKK